MTLIVIAALVVLTFGFVVAFGAPYVPSLRREVRSAFTKLYPLSNQDVVVDLGSGDGVVLKEAVAHGAKAYGYELNPLLVLISRLRLRKSAQVKMADMWKVKLPSDVTVVYVFSITRDVKRLSKYLQRETDRLQRPLDLVIYGERLFDREPIAKLRGHRHYRFFPLQKKEA